MGTEILKSFGNLQSELEQAKNSLKGVDENIKRLIGRDPSELPPRPGIKRGAPVDEKGPRRVVRNRNFAHENVEPPAKRRNNSGVSVFKRLSERPIHHEEDHQGAQKQMISKVIVTPKEIPSRQEALEAQNKDEKSKARNRRMFGALLGTLQKFQQEETKLKQREDKRAQLEKKIEEHEIKEKQEIKKEKQELFLNRRKKQAEIKMIELKMIRMREYSSWEERQKPRMNFITTKAKPHIHFLPRRMNDTSKALLEDSKQNIEKMIEKKKQSVFDELRHIEERMKRNFDNKSMSKDNKESNENDGDHNNHDDMEDHHDFDEDHDAVLTENFEEKSQEETHENHESEATSQVELESIEPTNGASTSESVVPENITENNSAVTENAIYENSETLNVNKTDNCVEQLNITNDVQNGKDITIANENVEENESRSEPSNG